MAITNFVPAIWSATLLSVLLKELVYGAPTVVNRDYEGEISSAGSSVNITSVGDPNIVTYTKDTDLTVQTLTDATRSLVITEQKAFDFEIDDIDLRQSVNGGALMAEAAFRAGFGLADTADQFLATTMNAGGTGYGAITVDHTTTNNTDVWNKVLVPLRTSLGKRNVPSRGRFVVLSPDLMGQLLLDSRFIRVNESGSDAAMRNGFIGRANGFDIFESNNVPASLVLTVTDATTTSGNKVLTSASKAFTQRMVGAVITGTGIGAANTVLSVSADGGTANVAVNSTASGTVTVTVGTAGGQAIIAGNNQGVTYAEQISKVEAFRPEKRFADALKGLHLYGAKCVRPEALTVADVTIV